MCCRILHKKGYVITLLFEALRYLFKYLTSSLVSSSRSVAATHSTHNLWEHSTDACNNAFKTEMGNKPSEIVTILQQELTM
jgi:hypothetical protein